MNIDWGSLLLVAIVSLAAAVAVVVLVALALVGVSAARSDVARPQGGASAISPAVGMTMACVCVLGSLAIVAYGIYLVAK
ncbi:hypothetical protein GCM10010464_88430 [Pseudonocardia yunnanensis]|uniref:DUF4190 domain-containing protein n=1 Tax=Pseudonocardia yunnanensis TaxID=58107 RepID=A0ABW4FAZ7_9PSEU